MNNPTYLDQYRQLLLSKHQELLAANGGRLIVGAAGGLAGPDFMDQAFAESEVMVDASVSQARSRLRRSIELALVRLRKGNYGVCAACGKPISRARLEALPWADCCRACVNQEED